MLKKRKRRKSTRVDTLIGQNSLVLGDLKFEGGLHIDGTVRGNVGAEGEDSVLQLSEKGTIEGEVRVPFVMLNGVVKGDVYAYDHIELAPNARVEGNVYYNLIEMAMGAEVNGHLVRLSEKERQPAVAADQELGLSDS